MDARSPATDNLKALELCNALSGVSVDNGWRARLRYDPLPPLLSSGNDALRYFVGRDLLGEDVEPVEKLWRDPRVGAIVRRQRDDGSWAYRGRRPGAKWGQDYDQLETYRVLRWLVELHGLDRRHLSVEGAAEFLFTRQTEEGDFRGIYGGQYTPNYSAGITELLVKAGYGGDGRVERVFRWLLSIRQDDGGWAMPFQTVGARLDNASMASRALEPDPSKSFSHQVTGVVLRAFAAHDEYRGAVEAREGGMLLASSLFRRGRYPGRQGAEFWTKFTFPFWFTDLLSALDSLSQIKVDKNDEQIGRGLDWFRERQRSDGGWDLHLLKGNSVEGLPLWMGLAICRVLKRFNR
jgi:hypothetical protein